jgi:ABC-type sugar transport system ATPase subunit
MAGVRLTGITKRYGDEPGAAVGGVSLEIPDGELFVLLGPSGCGKSTLLKLIAGLEEPSEGEIHIGDRLVNFVPPAQRNVAMVFQSYALYPHMTVRENIRFPLRMRKVAPDRARDALERASAAVGIEDLLGRRVEALSGGQRQRVAVARALVRDPSVMLMDEPLSNLDALLRTQTREQLLRLHRDLPGTIVYVTHDQVEAMTMGDRIGVMRDGRLLQVGSPLDVYARPRDRFVAGFIGSPPMSFIEGAVDRRGVFAGEGVELRLAPELEALVVPGPWTLGIRPEAVQIGPANGRPETPWRVDVLEHLGGERIIGLRCGTSFVRCRAGFGLELAHGDPVEVGFPREAVNLFGADGRNALG